MSPIRVDDTGQPRFAADSCAPLTPSAAPLVCASASMRALLREIERYAAAEVLLLIEGESGTGKSLLARHVHQSSPRQNGPFHALSLAAVDDALASSDLFGHEAGAFTDAKQKRHGAFVSANKGTLFLDEIGKASTTVQNRLLAAIEQQRVRAVGCDRDTVVDVRVIAASNVPLAKLAAEERFLPDLYARLMAFRVELPPLRKRPKDIDALVEHFTAWHAARLNYPGGAPAVSEPLRWALRAARWPFNIRELEGAVQRLLVNAAPAPVLGLEHCTGALAYLRRLARRARGKGDGDAAQPLLLENETKVAAARRLGISRPTLDKRLAEAARRQAATEASEASGQAHDEGRRLA